MAEFPDLGAHCAFERCGFLDFLPARCDACNKDFCQSHVGYDHHECENSYLKDARVPVCPLCQKPVPTGKNENVDEKVNDHIGRDCQADPQKKIAYKNKCSLKGCRKKEIVPITCSMCRRNFCIGHRHTTDHDCPGPQNHASTRHCKPKNGQPNNKQPVSDTANDEELARALQAMMSEGAAAALSPEEMDRRLAQQLQNEENQRGTVSTFNPCSRRGPVNRCTVS